MEAQERRDKAEQDTARIREQQKKDNFGTYQQKR
jgi:hypothetical protein